MGCNANECRFLSSLVHLGEPPGCCALPRRVRPILQGVLQDGGLHHYGTRRHTRGGPGGLPQRQPHRRPQAEGILTPGTVL